MIYLIDYCFQDISLNRIEIQTATQNIKCQRIAEKFGFKQEGILRQDEKLNGSFSDSYIFSLLKYEYYNYKS